MNDNSHFFHEKVSILLGEDFSFCVDCAQPDRLLFALALYTVVNLTFKPWGFFAPDDTLGQRLLYVDMYLFVHKLYREKEKEREG